MENKTDKSIEVYGFESVPEFKNELAKWNFFEGIADKKFGELPSIEKAEWVAEQMKKH